MFWLYPGSPIGWTCPENLQKKAEDPNRTAKPLQLAPFDAKKQGLNSELPLDV